MSIIHSLKKLADPGQTVVEEAEKKALREHPPETTEAPPTHVCKICGYRSSEDSYCPQCLAYTMRPERGR